MKILLIISFIGLLISNCIPNKETTTCPTQLIEVKNEKITNNKVCNHSLMEIEILPNPTSNDITRRIKFCYYEKKNGKLLFYADNGNKSIFEVSDIESVIW